MKVNFKQIIFFAVLMILMVSVVFPFSASAVTLPSSGADFCKGIKFTKPLKVGSTGKEVKCLQSIVGNTVTGTFGVNTKTKVKSLQKSNNITATGNVGPLTIAVLNSALETGSVSSSIGSLEYYVGPTSEGLGNGTDASNRASFSSAMQYAAANTNTAITFLFSSGDYGEYTDTLTRQSAHMWKAIENLKPTFTALELKGQKLKIDGFSVINNSLVPGKAASGYAMLIDGSNNEVSNSLINANSRHNSTSNAVLIAGNLNVIKNSEMMNAGRVLQIWGSNVQVLNNQIHGSTSSTVQSSNADGLLFQGNTVYDSDYHIAQDPWCINGIGPKINWPCVPANPDTTTPHANLINIRYPQRGLIIRDNFLNRNSAVVPTLRIRDAETKDIGIITSNEPIIIENNVIPEFKAHTGNIIFKNNFADYAEFGACGGTFGGRNIITQITGNIIGGYSTKKCCDDPNTPEKTCVEVEGPNDVFPDKSNLIQGYNIIGAVNEGGVIAATDFQPRSSQWDMPYHKTNYFVVNYGGNSLADYQLKSDYVASDSSNHYASAVDFVRNYVDAPAGQFFRSYENAPTTDAQGRVRVSFPDAGPLESSMAPPSSGKPPVVTQPAPITVDEDSLEGASGTIVATDPDGDVLIYSATSGKKGTAIINSNNGFFIYEPDIDAFGEDSFVVTVEDANNNSVSKTVSVTITPKPDAPIVSAITALTGSANNPQLITLMGTDVDEEILTYSVVQNPVHGTAVIAGNVLTYIPTENYTGTDYLTYKAIDPTGLISNTSKVSLTISSAPQSLVYSDSIVRNFTGQADAGTNIAGASSQITSQITVSIWVKREALPSGQYSTLVADETYPNPKGFFLGDLSSVGPNDPYCFRVDASTTAICESSATTNGTWVNYTGTYDGSNLVLHKIYKSLTTGLLVDAKTSKAFTKPFSINTGSVSLGGGVLGKTANLMLHRVALTDSQVMSSITMPVETLNYTLTTYVAAPTSPQVGGTITRNPDASTYAAGTTVELTAIPATGYAFSGWRSGCLSSSGNSCTVKMDKNKAIHAGFTLNTVGGPTQTMYSFTASSAGTGTGSISSAYGLSGTLPENTTITLTAMAEPGSTLSSWTGCTSTNGNVCTLTINSNKTITANFSLNASSSFALTTNVDPQGSGTVTVNTQPGVDGKYQGGTILSLTATPNPGYVFSSWSGNILSLEGGAQPSTRSIMMSEDKNVTAHFVPEQITLNYLQELIRKLTAAISKFKR